MKKNYALFFLIFFAFVLPKTSFGQCSSGCTTTISPAGGTTYSTAITVNSGQTVCITAPSGNITISGAVTVNTGGTLCVNASNGNINFTTNVDMGASGTTIKTYSASNDTVKITGLFGSFGGDLTSTFFNYGNLYLKTTNSSHGNGGLFRLYTINLVNSGYIIAYADLDIGSSANINNSGTFLFQPNTSVSGNTGMAQFNAGTTLTNTGTFGTAGDLSFAGSTVTNNGTLNVGGNLALSGTWTNSSGATLTVTGSSTANSSTIMTNMGTWNTNGANNTINFNLTNGGVINVPNGLTTINASGTLNFQGGRVYTKDILFNAGNMTTGTGCAAIVVTNNSNANANGFKVTIGSVDVTDLSQTHGATPALDANTCPVGPPINCGLTFSNSSGTNSCLSTLPITLLSLKASYISDAHVKIDWKVISDELGSDFIIERTEDLKNFKVVGTVPSSSILHQEIPYEFIDYNSSQSDEVYYRLNQKLSNGSTSVLGFVAPVKSEASNKIVSTPNPSNGNFKLSFYSEEKVNSLAVTNQTGKIVYSFENSSDLVLLNKDIELNSPRGIYIVEISTNKGIYYSKISIQ